MLDARSEIGRLSDAAEASTATGRSGGATAASHRSYHACRLPASDCGFNATRNRNYDA